MFNRGYEIPGWRTDLAGVIDPVPLQQVRAVDADVDVTVVEDPGDKLAPYLRSWRKRALDLVLGVPLALAALPVILVLALVVAGSLRAWPFFVQHRVGRGGRPFRIVKLRTLPPRTPPNASKTSISEIRTTRLARYLRRTHLDELPQLLLVVSGSMSLVGPRPEMALLIDKWAPDEAAFRSCVRPGCTGLWQISDDAGREIYECPQYDREYLQEAGAHLDLVVLCATARRVARSASRLWVAAPARS